MTQSELLKHPIQLESIIFNKTTINCDNCLMINIRLHNAHSRVYAIDMFQSYWIEVSLKFLGIFRSNESLYHIIFFIGRLPALHLIWINRIPMQLKLFKIKWHHGDISYHIKWIFFYLQCLKNVLKSHIISYDLVLYRKMWIIVLLLVNAVWNDFLFHKTQWNNKP